MIIHLCAGVIPYRFHKDPSPHPQYVDGMAMQYLAITSLLDKEKWVFPKGHIEEDETSEEAALREAAEEAGLEGIINPHNHTPYIVSYIHPPAQDKDGKDLEPEMHITYYFRMEVTNICWHNQVEGREMHWGSKQEIRNLLSFYNLKQLVR